MRTTVTLDPDTEALVRRRMRERGVSFKVALNEALREALRTKPTAQPFTTAPADLGRSRIPLERALQIAGDLEDEELVRKARAGR